VVSDELEEAASAIVAQKVEVLFYVDGHDAFLHQLLSCRLAPVQVGQ